MCFGGRLGVRVLYWGSDISRYISPLYFAVQAGKLFWQEDGMCFGGRLGARVLYWGSDLSRVWLFLRSHWIL